MSISSPTIARTARRAAATLGVTAALLTACAAGCSAVTPGQPAASPAAHRPVGTRCAIPSPVTAAGYTAMFAKLDPTVWGAADTALSVRLPGRAVWLFSDTASAKPGAAYDTFADWGRFVHSTAIMQTSGCLHVSNRGAQLLPDAGNNFYWIDSASVIDRATLRVTGYEMDYRTRATTGRFRSALVSISTAGDLYFRRWLGYVAAPSISPLVKDAGLLGNSVSYNGTVICDNILQPGPEYTYSPQLHPELGLASGETLLSLAVGWVSGPPTWQQARPIFREVALPAVR